MGYETDKRLVYKKHHFEEYLNSKESNDWWDNKNKDREFLGLMNNYPNSKYREKIGTVFRTHFKKDFNRQYLIWLNTK